MSSSSSSSYRARRGGSRQLQFPVGRWRHVAVVDAGCGCRPRRATTRLLSQLPSFLRPSAGGKPSAHHATAAPVGRSSSRSSSGFFPSSASTASSATFATTHSSHSNYSSSLLYDHSYKPPEHAPAPAGTMKVATAGSSASGKKRRGAEESGVGVAVEKESSDPRADFRESMVQMVVEMRLCGWDDLRCMLRRLLALNAPRHHAAFAEVCAQLTAPQPQPEYQYQAYDDYHYHY